MKEPLVSIIIPAYNSSRFIIDTLESARLQTYQNLELIVTDDASRDNTVEVCKKWLLENESRFRRTKLLLAGQNGGTSVNCNRGIGAARGDWIKFISGDDALTTDAIEKLVRFVNENRNIKVLDSKVDIYNHDFSEIIGHMDRGDNKFFNADTTALQQQKMIANNLKSVRIISSVGAFYSRELLNRVGGYTERFRFLEDALLYHKIFEVGEKFWYLDEVIYKYRRHSDALSLIDNNKDKIFSDLEIEIHQHFWEDYIRLVTPLNKLQILWIHVFTKIIVAMGNKGLAATLTHKFFMFFQPARLRFFRRIFQRLMKS